MPYWGNAHITAAQVSGRKSELELNEKNEYIKKNSGQIKKKPTKRVICTLQTVAIYSPVGMLKHVIYLL